jgi:hypothetical protein
METKQKVVDLKTGHAQALPVPFVDSPPPAAKELGKLARTQSIEGEG